MNPPADSDTKNGTSFPLFAAMIFALDTFWTDLKNYRKTGLEGRLEAVLHIPMPQAGLAILPSSPMDFCSVKDVPLWKLHSLPR